MFEAMSTPSLIAGPDWAGERDGIGQDGSSWSRDRLIGEPFPLARFLLGVGQVRASASAEADPGRDRRIASGPHSRTSLFVRMCRRYRTASCFRSRRKEARTDRIGHNGVNPDLSRSGAAAFASA